CTLWIIEVMGDIDVTKLEIRIARRDVLAAPVYAARHGIDAGIAGFGRVEILRQRHGHATDAGTDIEHARVGAKSAFANEVSEKLRADGAIIAIADEYAVRVGRRQKTVLQNRLHQPVDLRIGCCWFGFRFWLFQRY